MRTDRQHKQRPSLNYVGSLRAAPSLEADGLVLGAGTVLASVTGADGAAMQEDAAARLTILLKVAYGRSISGLAMGHVRAAATRWRQGDAGRASLHLALARLGQMPDPVAASQRLFVADALLRKGVSPSVFDEILDGDVTGDSLRRNYNPDQPRFPAGSGLVSGRWSGSGEDGSAPPAPLSTAVPRMTVFAPTMSQAGTALPRRLTAQAGAAVADTVGGIDLGAISAVALRGLVALLAEAAAAAAVPAALGLGLSFVPMNRGSEGRWVHLGGPNDLSFLRNLDEWNIRFKFKDASGKEQEYVAPPGPDGNYRGPDGRVIARWVKAGARVGLVISVDILGGAEPDEQPKERKRKPRLCPKVSPDRKGARPKNQDYEDYVKRIVNPQAPTPRAFGYALVNPTTGRKVVFDDCQKISDVLVEIKGTGYAKHFAKPGYPGKGMIRGMLAQAARQDSASEGREITWFFAEKRAADYVRLQFRAADAGRERIRIVTIPWAEGMK